MHSRVLSEAGFEQIRHSSPLDFFSSLLAGELAGRLSFIVSFSVPIIEHLDLYEHTKTDDSEKGLPFMVPFHKYHGTTALNRWLG